MKSNRDIIITFWKITTTVAAVCSEAKKNPGHGCNC